MKELEREDYNKKIRLYEKLGAEKFQDVVFKVEKIKYKIIKKLFPNYIKSYDKHLDRKQKKLLANAETEEEKKQIKREIKLSKLAIRKELNEEKNRNYHMDTERPTEIYKYLEWNKSVHIKGLIKDAIIVILSTVALSFGFVGALPVLLYELLNAAINFECINIQNCSICKYKKCQKILERKESRAIEKGIEEYGAAAEVINNALEESETLPTFDEIINNIKTKEQLEEMKRLIYMMYQTSSNKTLKNEKGVKK